jgi:hypothetical protein
MGCPRSVVGSRRTDMTMVDVATTADYRQKYVVCDRGGGGEGGRDRKGARVGGT